MAQATIPGIAASIVALIAVVGPAAADDFYKGKTVNLYIGSGAGGGYDLFGRLVARHIGRSIPGQPAVVPHNMPGAGSITAANFVYNSAPRDGTVLEIGTPSIAMVEALRTPGVRFESAKLNWIGRVASAINVTATWTASGVTSVEESRQRQVLLSSMAATSPLALYPKAMNAALGTRFKVIKGYANSNSALLAMERGEVEGSTVSWNTLNSGKQDWIRNNKIRIIVQYAMQRYRQVPDVPTAVEFARNTEERQLLTLFVNGADVGYSIMSTPDTPADRVRILRDAFDAMLVDKLFLEDVERMGAEFDPMPGEKLQALIREALDISPAVRERAQAALAAE